MSNEPQTNPLFTDFKPTEPQMPFTPAPAEAPTKRERKRKRAYPNTVATPAPPRSKTKRKPRPPKQPVAPEQVARPKLGFDLQTILRAAAELKDDDYPAFEPLLNTFHAMSKPQRERILAAIGKVFA